MRQVSKESQSVAQKQRPSRETRVTRVPDHFLAHQPSPPHAHTPLLPLLSLLDRGHQHLTSFPWEGGDWGSGEGKKRTKTKKKEQKAPNVTRNREPIEATAE